MREQCFVTGGTGYIGQHLLALLTSRGHPVTVLMRQPDALPALQALIEQHGGKNSGSVSGKTDYILAGENMGPAKLEKAAKLGVKIINEDAFLNMLE